jgi:hypothetical protein
VVLLEINKSKCSRKTGNSTELRKRDNLPYSTYLRLECTVLFVVLGFKLRVSHLLGK